MCLLSPSGEPVIIGLYMGSLSVKDFLRHADFVALSQLCKQSQQIVLRQLIILLSLVAQIPFIIFYMNTCHVEVGYG